MRMVSALAVFVILSSPAFGEPLSGSSPPADSLGAEAPPVLPFVPTNPTARPEAAAAMEDRNGNRVVDALEGRLASAASNERLGVVAIFDTPGHAAAARQSLGAAALREVLDLVPAFSATLTAGQARALARMPGLQRVEEITLVYASMETARRDFGIDRVAPLGFTGAEIGICIVDTGIFAEHEEFVDAITGVSKVIGFSDFVGMSPLPYDDHGHGTHVASIAAGDGTGIDDFAPRYRGVAPGALLFGAKVLDSNGQGSSDAVAAGINWCADQPEVDVINLSLGTSGSCDGNDLISRTVDAAVTQRGKVVVVAAGNEGAAPKTIGCPAAARQAITVGAAAEWSSASEALGESDGVYLAPFSSRGPTADGRVKPDLVSPGVSIIAAYIDPSGSGAFGCINDCYTALSGTSMATPFTAGMIALMLEANPALTPPMVSSTLSATARDRGPLGTSGAALKDNNWGYGLVDGYAAVAEAAAAADPAATIDTTPTALPSYVYGAGSVRGSGNSTVAIEVTDASVPLAITVTILDGGKRRFCDLFLGCFYEWRPDFDVRLLDPTGTEVASSICMLGAYLGEECDNVGRQETVHIVAPILGTYTLEVYKGTSDSRNGRFSYEISRGPLTGGASPLGATVTTLAGAD